MPLSGSSATALKSDKGRRSALRVLKCRQHVLALMLAAGAKLQIGRCVVAPIVIDMMDLHPLRDRSVMVRPHAAMKKPLGVTAPV
jgi:hypothetical protein